MCLPEVFYRRKQTPVEGQPYNGEGSFPFLSSVFILSHMDCQAGARSIVSIVAAAMVWLVLTY